MFKRFFSRKSSNKVSSNSTISVENAIGPKDHIIVAIGDIHGRQDSLCCLLDKLKVFEKSEKKRVRYVFLGDYIDRGPNSSQVIDFIIDWRAKHKCVFLLGNHEASLLQFLEAPIQNSDWLNFGGIDTALSYNVRPPIGRLSNSQIVSLTAELKDKITNEHLEFFRNLKLFYECGDYLFVHAGVYVDRPLSQNNKQSYLWMREPFLSSNTLYSRVIIHGHTITQSFEPEIRPNRIGIDTGSYLNGKITALIIDGAHRQFIFSND